MQSPWLHLGQEKKWGNSVRGRPTGKFCFDCLSVLISLFPDSDPEEMANKYHTDPICKREVDAAMKIFVELEERNFQAQSPPVRTAAGSQDLLPCGFCGRGGLSAPLAGDA